jgi:hypothetical protein
MDAKTRRTVFIVPLLAWAGLLVATGFNVVYARLPGAPGKPGVTAFVALVMLVVVVVIDMRVARSPWVVRLAALLGFTWLGLFFVLSLADYFTR